MAQPTFTMFRNTLILNTLVRSLMPRVNVRVFSTTDLLKNESGIKRHRDYTGGLRDLKKRTDKMKWKGTYHSFKRSQFQEWNYDAELYAFGRRLNETFDDNLLREAMTDQSYVHEERKRLEEVGMSDSMQLVSNRDLAAVGKALVEDFSKKYFRAVWPLVPEEGIEKIAEHLTSIELLGKIGSTFGLKDLILCQEYVPTEDIYARGFLALIGALNGSSGIEKTHKFIADFVLTQMVGKSIWDVWQIHDPLRVLERLTENCGMGGPPEPRLLGQIGQNTLESVYHIGIYVNKELFEMGYGETIKDGVASAAYNSLSKLFDQKLDSSPLPFEQNLKTEFIKSLPNKLLRDWDGKEENLVAN